jgi:CubicO group peptidase (beta-lactamase class C family)
MRFICYNDIVKISASGGNKMFKKLLRSGITFFTALTLIAMPHTYAYAQTSTVALNNIVNSGSTVTGSSTSTEVNYEEAIALAKKKAAFLTSIYNTTSVQYALIDNGEIVFTGEAGINNKEQKTIPTKNNMYGIGSISKIVTTVAVMQLVDQGKVALDTPLVQYIPEFKMADERYKDITVRMLLNHSSGLLGSTFLNTMLFNDNDETNYNNLLNLLSGSRLKAEPGEFSVYCNDGFTLAQILVERVTGTSFTKYISEFINQPLDLSYTKTPVDQFDRNLLAKTYQIGSGDPLPVENLNAIGAGGMYSSAEDLCKFAQIFMRDGNSNVLSANSAKAMENQEYLNGLWPKEEVGPLSFGLGWDSVDTYPFNEYGIKAVVKGGDTTLYHGSLIVLPEENMAMAVLSSGGASTYNQIMAQEVLLTVLKSKGKISEIKPYKTFAKPVKADMPSDLQKNAGNYAHFSGIAKVTISNDGILTLSDAMDEESMVQKFTYTGDGQFHSSDGSIYLNFITESNEITYLNVSGYSMLPGMGQVANSCYQGQKLENNPISSEVKASWLKRDNKKYFILNEKFDSILYVLSSPMSKLSLFKDLEGYCLNAKIIDKNNAKVDLQIPGVYGRDLFDLSFYTVGKIDYVKSNANILISEDYIKTLSSKSSFKVKLGKDGYANWFKLGKSAANKKISVKQPKNASFSIYDENGTLVYNSFITKQSTITLPAKGYIVFVGSPNAEFTVKHIK